MYEDKEQLIHDFKKNVAVPELHKQFPDLVMEIDKILKSRSVSFSLLGFY